VTIFLLNPRDYRIEDLEVTVVGAGYVGITLACVVAEAGAGKVWLVDANPRIVEVLSRGRVTLQEKRLSDMYKRHHEKNIFPSLELDRAVEQSNIVEVVVGTPLDALNRPQIWNVVQACKDVALHAKAGSLTIVSSTVPVGTTRHLILPLFRSKTCDNGVGLAFCPERMIEGDAISSMRRMPKIIGGINRQSSVAAQRFYQLIGLPTMVVSSPECAELSKLLCNAYRATNIALANEFAIICEVFGLNAFEVFKAANSSYIVNIMRPGLMGGSCLTKDPRFLIDSCLERGYQPRIVSSAMLVNEGIFQHVVELCVDGIVELGKRIDTAKVAILGVSFKGGTSDIRESPVKRIIDLLKKRGFRQLVAFDPYVTRREIEAMGVSSGDLEAVISDADCIIIGSDHPEFKHFLDGRLGDSTAKKVVVDAKGFIEEIDLDKVELKGIGLPSTQLSRRSRQTVFRDENSQVKLLKLLQDK